MRQKQYNERQIITSQYTSGGEFTLDGNDYIGSYHILPDGTHWTLDTQSSESKFLSKYDVYEFDEEVKRFKRNIPNKAPRYISPIPYTPNVDQIDYTYQTIERYFVQNVSNSKVIIEIDLDQYRSINIRNYPGIDGLLWRKTMVTWYLNKTMAAIKNPVHIKTANKQIPGLSDYLVNIFEFTK